MSVEPPLLKRAAAMKKIGAAGRKAEKGLAHRLGGTLTLASGAMQGDKGDVKVERGDLKFLMESKATQNESMSVKLDWLLKIYQEALEAGKHPAFAISFTNDHGVATKRGTWIAVPEAVFKELIGD